jgi:2-phospho-L-lactate guanylyltransferase
MARRTHPAVDLVVPVKPLAAAKSRLLGAADGGAGDVVAHTRLTLAMAQDTVAAALAAARVRRVLVVSSDPAVSVAFATLGVEVVSDDPVRGLNPAYARGAALLRDADPGCAVGALQADLPALRPAELDAAIGAALGQVGRAFCPDAEETGTTLLLAAPGCELDPRFGPESARHHERSGARRLAGHWPGLRRDVDTPADLDLAECLGLGVRTRAVRACGEIVHSDDGGIGGGPTTE